MQETVEQMRQAAEQGSQAVKGAYAAAQQYVQDASLDSLRDMVRRQPWLALALAFGVGYVAAQIARRVA
ncbi:MAG: hypothetical protein WA446_14690 [Steroidobacteraceae bacterium]